MRAAAALSGVTLGNSFVELLRDMRRLRQRIDEIDDLFEDLFTGLLTYPILVLLSRPGGADAIRRIDKAWRCVETPEGLEKLQRIGARATIQTSPELLELEHDLMQMLVEEGVLDQVYEEACNLYKQCMQGIDDHISILGDDMHVVLDLKRAFLERLRVNGWRDTPEAPKLRQIIHEVVAP